MLPFRSRVQVVAAAVLSLSIVFTIVPAPAGARDAWTAANWVGVTPLAAGDIVLASDDGLVHLAQVNAAASGPLVYTRRVLGGHWQEAYQVDPGTPPPPAGLKTSPSLAALGNEVAVAWSQPVLGNPSVSGEIFASYSAQGGQRTTWERIHVTQNLADDDLEPDVVIGGPGKISVVWANTVPDGTTLWFRSVDPTPDGIGDVKVSCELTPGVYDNAHPSLEIARVEVSPPPGIPVQPPTYLYAIVYERPRLAPLAIPEVYHRTLTVSGDPPTCALGPETQLSPADGIASFGPSTAAYLDRWLYVVWSEANGQVLFRRSPDFGATWGPVLTVSSSGSSAPSLATCGFCLGVVWVQSTGPGARVFFSESRDFGSTWSAPLDLAPGVNALGPRLASAVRATGADSLWTDFSGAWIEQATGNPSSKDRLDTERAEPSPFGGYWKAAAVAEPLSRRKAWVVGGECLPGTPCPYPTAPFYPYLVEVDLNNQGTTAIPMWDLSLTASIFASLSGNDYVFMFFGWRFPGQATSEIRAYNVVTGEFVTWAQCDLVNHGGTWAPPTPRYAATAIYDGVSRVYVVGGLRSDGTYLNEILVLDFAAGCSGHPNIQGGGLAYSTGFWEGSVGNVGYLLGGSTPGGESRTIWRLEPGADPQVVPTIASLPATVEVSLSGAAVGLASAWNPASGEAYVFGGSFDGQSRRSILTFKPSTMTVREECVPLGGVRSFASSIWDSNPPLGKSPAAFVFGGPNGQRYQRATH